MPEATLAGPGTILLRLLLLHLPHLTLFLLGLELGLQLKHQLGRGDEGWLKTNGAAEWQQSGSGATQRIDTQRCIVFGLGGDMYMCMYISGTRRVPR